MKQETYENITKILDSDKTILKRTKRAVLKALVCTNLPSVNVINYKQAIGILKCSRQTFATLRDNGQIHPIAENKYMQDEILALRKQQVKNKQEVEKVKKSDMNFAIDWTIPYELIQKRKELGLSHIDVLIIAKIASDNFTNAFYNIKGRLKSITHPYELNARNLGKELGVCARTINRRVRVLINNGYLIDVEPHRLVCGHHVHMLHAYSLFENDAKCRVIDAIIKNTEITPCEKLYLSIIADKEKMSYTDTTKSNMFNFDVICILVRTGYLKNIDGYYFVNRDKFTM